MAKTREMRVEHRLGLPPAALERTPTNPSNERSATASGAPGP